MSTKHISVMPQQVLVGLLAANGGDFIDCTLGGAGHTEMILDAHPSTTVLGCDRDDRALARASNRLERFGSRISFAKASFSELESACQGRKFDGLLADLGVSTDQLFEERGFSFKDETPLDMRMDQTASLTADEVVNQYSDKELIRVLREGGVGNDAKAIVRAIMQARPIATTSRLAEVISAASFARFTKKKVHPATVAFQAIRMEVNQEQSEINSLLDQMPRLLNPKGRAVVISFHSGEDKLVARTFRKWAGGDEAPAWWQGERKSHTARLGKMVQNEADRPSQEEIDSNSAARSARLRVFVFGEG